LNIKGSKKVGLMPELSNRFMKDLGAIVDITEELGIFRNQALYYTQKCTPGNSRKYSGGK